MSHGISEHIEQGDGGTHDEVTARSIVGSQGEDTAKRSGDTQEKSEEAPGWNKNPTKLGSTPLAPLWHN